VVYLPFLIPAYLIDLLRLPFHPKCLLN